MDRVGCCSLSGWNWRRCQGRASPEADDGAAQLWLVVEPTSGNTDGACDGGEGDRLPGAIDLLERNVGGTRADDQSTTYGTRT